MANNNVKWILAGATGLLIGHWWTKRDLDISKKSRSEREEPELTEDVCVEISELLNELELIGEFSIEDEYRDAVADFLSEYSAYEIETAPSTQFGKPDILVEAVLALEIKLNPSKAEMDRCIGQCAGYSREWATWIVLFDTPSSMVRQLEHILSDKGLEYIPVISFS